MAHLVLALVLAVLGAACFAGAAVVQQRDVSAVVDGRGGGRMSWREARALLRQPGWLGGVALSAGGAGLHITALTLAPLSAVQPVGVLAVPIAVLLVAMTTHRRPASEVLVGVVLTVAGVAVFVGLAAGTRAGSPASGATLLLVGAVVATVVVTLGGLALSSRGWVRCLACAAAGAVAFGLVSALLRTVLTATGSGRLGPFDPAVLTMVAAMGVAVLVGGWLVQEGLAAGSPEVVLACITVVDPIVAVTLGAVLLGEGVAGTVPWLAVTAAFAVAGVVVLARHHPAAGGRVTGSGAAVVHPARPGYTPPAGGVAAARRRIVIGVDTFPPDVNGAARFADRLATGLARRGHDVHVVAPSATGAVGTERSGPVTVHRLRSHRCPRPGFRVCLPWETAPAAAALLDRLEPEIVHVHSHFAVGRALVTAARRRGLPVVATNHVMPENLIGHVPLAPVLRRAGHAWLWADLARVFRGATVVTAPTPRAVQLLVAAGLPDAVAVSCGIDVDAYTPVPRDVVDNRTPTVLFVGRLDEEKRVGELLRAFADLPGGRRAQLEIIGDGSRRATWTALADGVGLTPSVRFRGFVPEDELVEAYRRAAVFVMPGIAELQSLATLEAMAAGTPIIAADAMALPHLVRPGHNGWLYPPGDVPALTSRLASLLADPVQRRRMGAASREIVAEHAMGTTLTTFEELYRQSLDPAGARRDDRSASRPSVVRHDAVPVTSSSPVG